MTTSVFATDLNRRSALVLVGLLIFGGGLMGWALSQTTHLPEPDARVMYMKRHPCPANGNTRGACPGYALNYVKPLCAGGPGRPTNVQWLSQADAKRKDRLDAQECRAARRQKAKSK
ncbi:MAG TPA: hypothetical protein VE085_13830 [Burkholderiales bacterium]|nr:hypothetical protein [Burkholderiales bacterium]